VGSEFQVNTYTTGDQGVYPYGAHLVASDASGNFIVVWSGSGAGDSAGVFGQRYDETGVRLGSEFRVNSYTTGGQGSPSVVAAADGEFVVVWAGQGKGDSYGIFGQRYDSAGSTLGNAFLVNAYTTGVQWRPSAAAAADGTFVVVWGGSGPGDLEGIFGQRFDNAGVALGAEFRVNSYTTYAQYKPSVASDASGNFVVVWEHYNYARDVPSHSFGQRHSSAGAILHLPLQSFGQRYNSAGAALGTEFSVAGVTTFGLETTVSVASDASGNFVVVWDSINDGSDFGIRGQRYDSDGATLGDDFVVNSYTKEYQLRPSVAADASGNFVVAWADNRQAGWDVFGRRFDSEGVAQGGDFPVNTYRPFVQERPSVGATGANQFVVVWESLGQDGGGPSEAGVFGQRYNFADITVTSPNTNVRWRIGSQHHIQWTHTLGAGKTFRIELDRDDDGNYEELVAAAAPGGATRGSYGWTVTGPPSGTARMRISWTDDPSVSDASDTTFQIRP